jgi:PAS domain S-box-containing protein
LREGITVGLANHTLLIARDGEEFPIADSGAPVRGNDGGIVGAVLVFRDQTEERRAQAQLDESRKRMSTVLDSIDAAIYVADMESYELLFVNSYLLNIFGDAILGKPCYQVLQGKDSPCGFCSNNRLLDKEGRAAGVYRWEFQNRFSGRWYDMRDRAIEWLDGRLVKLEIANDITDRKEIEEALRQSERDLKRAQHMARIGSWRFDLGTNMVQASEEAHRIYGIEKESLAIEDVQTIPLPEYRKELDTRLRELLEQGKPYDVEFRICRIADGEVRHIRSVAEYDRENNFVIGTIHDITERAHLEEQLRQAQKLESLGRLAGGVAHDFNNMLSVITGHAELAMQDVEQSEATYDHFQNILYAANRSANITRQLLGFARRQTIAPQVLDLNETVGGLLTMLRRIIGENIELLWHPAADPCRVKMDPTQIDQILANLCVNAGDAIDDVGGITIETGAAYFDESYCRMHAEFQPGEYVQLTVSDDGCGMDETTKSKLFEPFFTTKEAGKGTGLGLATVYGIVRQNSGFINIYSELGRGTTVKIYLPCCTDEPQSPSVRHKSGEPTSAHGETVLMVEDEQVVLEFSKIMLERLGYRVLTAATPGEALEMVETHGASLDLLITDVIMPEMDGRSLAEKVTQQCPGTRVLYISGYTASVISRYGILEKEVHFLQKPFSMHDLAEMVRKALATGDA